MTKLRITDTFTVKSDDGRKFTMRKLTEFRDDPSGGPPVEGIDRYMLQAGGREYQASPFDPANDPPTKFRIIGLGNLDVTRL